MVSMDESILTLVRGGVISPDDAVHHLSNPDLLTDAAARPGDPGIGRRAA
jgi:hypothetical protein